MRAERLIYACSLILTLCLSIVFCEIEPRYNEKIELSMTSTVSSYEISLGDHSNLVRSVKKSLVRRISLNRKRFKVTSKDSSKDSNPKNI